MEVFKKTQSAFAFILFYFDWLRLYLYLQKHRHIPGIPSWCLYSSREERGTEKALIHSLLATLQQSKLPAHRQTLISQVCNCLPQLHLSQRPPTSPQMHKQRYQVWKASEGNKKHQEVCLTLLTPPHECRFLTLIYVWLIGAQLPRWLELLPVLPQGDNEFAPPLRSPCSGSLIKRMMSHPAATSHLAG